MTEIKYHVLDGHELKPATLLEWAAWLEAGPHFVKIDALDGVKVITICIGVNVDSSFPGVGPSLFESRVFGGKHHGETGEYSTWDDALRGHERLVALVRGAVPLRKTTR